MTIKTIEQAIQAASRCLEGVGLENPRMESEFLVAALLRIPRTHLIIHREEMLPARSVPALRAWVRERQKRKPLAYVTGEQPFRDFNLRVSTSVLIPRPETELLVEQAMRCLDRMSGAVTAIDVGTGSGNIAISLSFHPQISRVIGIDRSPAALRVARSNHRRFHEGRPIQWLQGNLLSSAIKRKLKANVIVANLPYVRTEEMEALEPELHWEPSLALDGGAEGLDLIEPCIAQSAKVLSPRGILLLEIGAGQSRDVIQLLRQSGEWVDIKVFSDLSGLPRIAQAERKGA
jgi:release factor glutamine methyltransferase